MPYGIVKSVMIKKIEIENENDKRLDLFNINWWPYVIIDGNSAW